MNNEKQYLFTANGSYFGKTLIAATFLCPIIYGVIDRGGIDYNETNILMLPVGVALLLAIATVTEACYNAGFSDSSRFIAKFKEKFGMTPLKYKMLK